jgi:hypothetical protein
MDFMQLIRDYKLADIITVDGTSYAVSIDGTPVPGCVPVSFFQYHQHVRTFLKGHSQLHGKPYSTVAGLGTWVLFTYTVKPLTPSQKQMFSHALAGTGGRKGLLASWHGEKIGQSAFVVPKTAEHDVKAFLAQWRVAYTAEVVLRG